MCLAERCNNGEHKPARVPAFMGTKSGGLGMGINQIGTQVHRSSQIALKTGTECVLFFFFF